MNSAPEISPRLRKRLRSAFFEMDPTGMQDFADWLRDGGGPWFLEELAVAIRRKAITPALWERITYVNSETDEDVERDLREGWRILAPGKVFPLDEASG